jgi:hypothetical protein
MVDPIWITIFIWLPPSIMLTMSLIGSVLGNVVFARKSMHKFPLRHVYRALLIIDAVCMTKLTVGDAIGHAGFPLNFLSDLACKLYMYTSYSWCAIPAWLLVFISLERCLSIVAPSMSNCFHMRKIETCLVLLAVFYNSLLYIPFLLYIELTVTTTITTNEGMKTF